MRVRISSAVLCTNGGMADATDLKSVENFLVRVQVPFGALSPNDGMEDRIDSKSMARACGFKSHFGYCVCHYCVHVRRSDGNWKT